MICYHFWWIRNEYSVEKMFVSDNDIHVMVGKRCQIRRNSIKYDRIEMLLEIRMTGWTACKHICINHTKSWFWDYW